MIKKFLKKVIIAFCFLFLSIPCFFAEPAISNCCVLRQISKDITLDNSSFSSLCRLHNEDPSEFSIGIENFNDTQKININVPILNIHKNIVGEVELSYFCNKKTETPVLVSYLTSNIKSNLKLESFGEPFYSFFLHSNPLKYDFRLLNWAFATIDNNAQSHKISIVSRYQFK